LGVIGADPNVGASYTVYDTSTGQKLETLTDSQGLLDEGDYVGQTLQNVTVKDSLGSSVTLPVVVVKPHKY
jgi:hypothetical protein